jgi:hypothetical protein
MSFRNAYHTDQGRRVRAARRALRLRSRGAASGRSRRGACASGPGSAGGHHRRCRGSGSPGDPQATVHPGMVAVGHPQLLRRNLHVLRRPASQPSTAPLDRNRSSYRRHAHGRDLTAPRNPATPLGPPPRNARFCLLTELRGLAAAQAKVAVAARHSADRNVALDRSQWP